MKKVLFVVSICTMLLFAFAAQAQERWYFLTTNGYAVILNENAQKAEGNTNAQVRGSFGWGNKPMKKVGKYLVGNIGHPLSSNTRYEWCVEFGTSYYFPEQAINMGMKINDEDTKKNPVGYPNFYTKPIEMPADLRGLVK